MLAARDLVGHADGRHAAVAAVKASGLDLPRRYAQFGFGFRLFPHVCHQRAVGRPRNFGSEQIILAQLADFMWNEIKTVEERITTARHLRIFPGEGVLRRSVPLSNQIKEKR